MFASEHCRYAWRMKLPCGFCNIPAKMCKRQFLNTLNLKPWSHLMQMTAYPASCFFKDACWCYACLDAVRAHGRRSVSNQLFCRWTHFCELLALCTWQTSRQGFSFQRVCLHLVHLFHTACVMTVQVVLLGGSSGDSGVAGHACYVLGGQRDPQTFWSR